MQKKAGKFPRLFMLSLVSFCAWFSANRAAPLLFRPYKTRKAHVPGRFIVIRKQRHAHERFIGSYSAKKKDLR